MNLTLLHSPDTIMFMEGMLTLLLTTLNVGFQVPSMSPENPNDDKDKINPALLH